MQWIEVQQICRTFFNTLYKHEEVSFIQTVSSVLFREETVFQCLFRLSNLEKAFQRYSV